MDFAQDDLRKRLTFETVLSELSSRFVNVESADVDREIEEAQRQVCECLALDIAALWQLSPDVPGVFTMTHHYRVVDDPPIPEDFDAREYFPWALGRVLAGDSVTLSSIDAAPVEAATDCETWRYFGIKSVFLFPLSTGGDGAFGAASFHSVEAERSYPDEIVQRLQLVSQIFANAVVRKRADAALHESEERLQLAADAAGVGMWMLDAESGRFWANDRGRELFGFEKDTEITIARVLQSVCSEHREFLETAVRRAVEDGLEINIEYRIALPDGSGRWIHSKGRRLLATAPDAPRILGASVDISGRKRSEARQAERLRFETLLADLSTTFVSLAADEVDAAIENAQRMVCEHLDIELSALWQWSPADPESQTLTHLHRPADGSPIPNGMDARQHLPWSLEQVVAGRTVILSSIDDAPPEAARSKETWKRLGVKSTLIIPLAVGREPAVGSLSFNSLSSERMWPDELVQRLRLVAEIFANALKRKHSEERLRDSFAEIERLKDKLELENVYLKQEHDLQLGSGRIVGESPELMAVLELVTQVAPAEATVLILGETGTGKELVAQRIHELSRRRDRPMVKVNCAALPSTLVESELFGHEKGAYTGAVSREAGRFEIADGSTIFLDEIAELPLELQAKLLRVLEEGRFERVGSSRTLSTDVRVVAATNRDLKAEVEAKRFRSDLFFRLAVFPITLPPLRERRGDIPLLVWSMVQELSTGMNRTVESIRREDMERLQRYDWPGNVRELR
ncbi:MAG TPA: sigma 54-interacting transcriptional regulator, partial [Chondromyces sp.]|nr:sigma 54-interacting transcriptional regulator [Chondromyces sp.]